MLVGSYRHAVAAPKSPLKGPCRVSCLCPQRQPLQERIMTGNCTAWPFEPIPLPYSDRLGAPPPELQWTASPVHCCWLPTTGQPLTGLSWPPNAVDDQPTTV